MRVVDRVTVMHNGRVLKHRHARRDRERRRRCRRSTWGASTDGLVRRDRKDGGERRAAPVLVVEGLDVYYGRAHALQGVSLALERGVLGIVGRNGMGKTTLCNAITGLVPARGSVRLFGEEIRGLAPNRDHPARHRLRAAGAARLAVAAASTRPCAWSRGSGATSTASTRCSRAWPSARATAARSSPAASSRCWRSAAPCCSSRSCW